MCSRLKPLQSLLLFELYTDDSLLNLLHTNVFDFARLGVDDSEERRQAAVDIPQCVPAEQIYVIVRFHRDSVEIELKVFEIKREFLRASAAVVI